jgi:LPXTG-motif cell wall-anchored protein
VVGVLPPTTTTTTTTSTTTSTTTTVPGVATVQVKKKALPDTGLPVSDLVYYALCVLLFGAGLVFLSRRRELRW